MNKAEREKRLVEAIESVQRAKSLFGTERKCLLCKKPFTYETNEFTDWWGETLQLCASLDAVASGLENGFGNEEDLPETKQLFAELSMGLITHTAASEIAVACDPCMAATYWRDRNEKAPVQAQIIPIR